MKVQRYIPYLAVLFLVLFAMLASVVMMAPQALAGFDSWFAHALIPLQTPFGLWIFQGITFFGGVVGVVLGVIAVMWFFRHRPDIIARLLIAIIGASFSVEYLKVLIHRVRPDSVTGLIIPNTFSFPSGHSTSAMVLYGFLALLLYVHAKRPTTKVLALVVPAFFIWLVGLSRLVLGYHYPSDVIGGYLFGAFWIMFSLAIPLRHELYHGDKNVSVL